jgi:WD40 repeat protein/uncharacterized caspase-like protein
MSHARCCCGFLLVLTALALVPAARAQDAQAPRRKYALLIGVSQYENDLQGVTYAERDVEELAEVLVSAGYERQNVWVMTTRAMATEPRLYPNATHIRKQLKAFLDERTHADSVLIAFAGHGVQFKGDRECYLCPADADLDDDGRSTLIPLGKVYDRLQQCGAGVKLVLVDACRNDPRINTSRSPRAIIDLESVAAERPEPPGGMAVLYSCSRGQKAFEDPKLEHGVFFHFLILGLRGKAADPDTGEVTLGRLTDYVGRAVDDYTRRHHGQRQTPSLLKSEMNGPVVLARVDPATVSASATAPVSVRATAPVGRVGELRRCDGHSQVVSSVACFLRDGSKRGLSGSYDGTVRVWDLETGQQLACFRPERSSWVWSVAAASDGRSALAGYSDGTVRLWDLHTGKELKSFAGHTASVCAVAFAADGRLAASGGEDGVVFVWDVAMGKELRRLEGHVNTVKSVAFSPNGRFVLSGSEDRTAQLWDVVTGRAVRTLTGHIDAVLGVALSDTRAVTASQDGTVRVWDVVAGEEVRRFRMENGGALCVALSSDGKRCLAGGEDKVLRLWDLDDGQQLARLQGHATAVQSVAFSVDGRQALTGSGGTERDNSVRLWQLP